MNIHRRRLSDPGARSLFRNSLFVTAGQGSVALLFVTYILAARILGDSEFGEFSLGLAVANVLFMLVAWGSNGYSAIMAARDPDRTREIVATNLALTLCLCLLYFPAVVLTTSLLSDSSSVVWIAALLGADLLAREFGNLLRLMFRVHDQYPSETATAFAERGAIVVLAGAVLLLQPSALNLAASFALGRALGALATAVLFIRQTSRIGLSFDPLALRELILEGTPLALRRGLGEITFRVDMLFLGRLRPAEEVGWYNAIYTFMDGVIMLPNSVNGSLGPTFSASHAEGRDEIVSRLFRRGVKYLLIVGGLLGPIMGTLAAPIVTTIYGQEYVMASAALRILSVSVVLILLRALATEVMDNVDLRHSSAWIFALGLGLNVFLNFLMIPRFGYLGAAWSTVATELVLVLGMLWVLGSAGYKAHLLSQAAAPAGASFCAFLVLWFMRGNPLVACLGATVVYFLGLWLLGVWDDKDRQLWQSILARVGRVA